MYRDLQSDSKTFQFPSPPAHHELLRTKRDAWRQTSDCVLFSVLLSAGAFGISPPQLHWGCAHYSCAMGTPLLPLGLGSHFPRSQQTWGDCIHGRDHEMRFQLMEGRGFHSQHPAVLYPTPNILPSSCWAAVCPQEKFTQQSSFTPSRPLPKLPSNETEHGGALPLIATQTLSSGRPPNMHPPSALLNPQHRDR